MDVLSVLRASVRRGYVFLLIVGAGIAFGVFKYQRAVPVYTMTTQLIVLSSPTEIARTYAPGAKISSNPYAAQLPSAATAAAGTMTSFDALAAVRAQGVTATFIAATEPQGIIILVTATDGDYRTLPLAVTAFVNEAKVQFKELQLRAGAPAEHMLQLQPLASPGGPLAGFPRRSRTLGAIILGSIVLAGLGAVTVDVALLSFRARRQQQGAVRESKHVAMNDSPVVVEST